MPNPQGIDLTAGLMALFIVLDVFIAFHSPIPTIPNATMPPEKMAAFAHTLGILFALFEAIIVFFYWKGHNWARWFVMVWSVVLILSLIGVVKAFHVGPLNGVVSIAKALLSAFLLWYLNTPPIKAWYEKKLPALPVTL